MANTGNNSGRKHSQLCCERSNGAGGAVLEAAVRASVHRAPLLSRKVAGASFPFVRNAELPRAPVGSSRASTAARNLRCRWLADELSRRRDEGEWDFSATYRACLLSAMYSKISTNLQLLPFERSFSYEFSGKLPPDLENRIPKSSENISILQNFASDAQKIRRHFANYYKHLHISSVEQQILKKCYKFGTQ